MTFRLTVDERDPSPPYAQLRTQLESAIVGQTLPDGQQLPPVRQLAKDLGIAAGTVARTYRELEQAGLVRTARGAGTRVVAPARLQADQRQAQARRVAADAVTRLRALGVEDHDVRELIAEALGELRSSATVG